MLLHHKQLFRMICYFPSKFGFIPLSWKESTHQFVFRQDDITGFTSKRKLYIQYIIYMLVPLQGLQCFFLNPDGYTLSFTDKMIYGLVLFGLFAAITLQTSCVRKAASQKHYINGIIQLSKSVPNRKKDNSMIKKLDFAFAACLTPNVAVDPLLFAFGLHWFSPCKPSLAGFLLIPECSSNYEDGTNTTWNILAKFVICAANQWSWTAGMFCAGYCTAGILVLGVLSFVDFLYVFEQLSKEETEENIYKTGIFYRKIQILGCFCNEVQQSDLMLVIIVGGTLVLVSAINAAFLVPWTMENAFGLVLFALCMVDMSFLLLVCAGAMAEIFQEFDDALDRLKRRKVMIGQRGKRLCCKWRERFYLSCTPIKFKFGQFNFVERLTPLNCIMFAIDQSVSLLLLSKEY